VNRAVLDASAVLAVLNGEPGNERVTEVLPDAAISAVNLSEVMAKLAEWGMPQEAIVASLSGLGLKVYPFDEATALPAAMLRPQTKALGLSFGDRACLALGVRLSAPILTTDRHWRSLRLPVKVEVIR
jgi:PIN domain nuclease of toxin-antitoxin system